MTSGRSTHQRDRTREPTRRDGENAPETPASRKTTTALTPARLPEALPNLHLQELLRTGAVRRKSASGAPSDPLEREADAVAEAVVQRKQAPCSCGGTCPACRARAEEEGVQRKRMANQSVGQPSPARSLTRDLGPGRRLDPTTRGFFEGQLGHDFSQTRVHADATADASARSINARAYTSGSDVVFAQNEYAPETASGRQLLAHELVHVVQQSNGLAPAVQREERDPTLEPAAGDQLTVRGPYTSGNIEVHGGEHVIAQANPYGLTITVALSPPHPQAGEPFRIPVAMLRSSAKSKDEQSEVHVNVSVLSAADFEAQTGLPAAALPEGAAIPLDAARNLAHPSESNWAPGVGAGLGTAPWPAFDIPPNATGVQWTQSSFGHFSQLSNVPGDPTIKGYRSLVAIHGAQWAYSKATKTPWTKPVPGWYLNDWIFRSMSPESQTIVYREGSPQHAQLVAKLIAQGRYTESYTFPPSGTKGTACTNCITVPKTEIYGALGGKPVIVTDQGIIDITEMGRGKSTDPFTVEQAGRGKAMREWLKVPTVQTPTGDIETLKSGQPKSSTVWGARGVTCIRAGGYVLLVYGAYQTTKRLAEASGTDQMGRVTAQETGSWIGGLLAGALGSAATSAIVCTPTGPGAFACAVAGFAGGLFLGMGGSQAGARAGDYMYRFLGNDDPPAGALALPHPYWIMMDMILDTESLDPEGARDEARVGGRRRGHRLVEGGGRSPVLIEHAPNKEHGADRDHAPHRPLPNREPAAASIASVAPLDNLSMQGMLRSGRVQPKLTIGSPDDPLEREADDVANTIVQRKACSCGGTCPSCRAEEEEQLRRKPADGGGQAAPTHARAAPERLGAGRPLDPTTRGFFESHLDHDLARTRIHTGADAADAASSINARAFTYGEHVAFGAGEFAPESTDGLRLLAHELAHVKQQSRGVPNLVRRDPPPGSKPAPATPAPTGATPAGKTEVIDKPPPKPGWAQVSFEYVDATYILSPDAAYLRYLLAQQVSKGGWPRADGFIAAFKKTVGGKQVVGQGRAARVTDVAPYGPAATPKGKGRVEKIVPMLETQRTELKAQIAAFGAQVRAAAYTRLEKNRENLVKWSTYVANLDPEQVAADLFVQESRQRLGEAVNSPSKGPHDPMDMMERWSWSTSAWEREYLERYNRGEIHGGCQECHSEQAWRNRESSSPTKGLSAIAPAVRAKDYRAAEFANPAPFPDMPVAEFSGISEKTWGAIGGRPGVSEIAATIDAIVPKLTPLGDSGYRIINTSVVNAYETTSQVVSYVLGAIGARREDYKTLMGMLQSSEFDFYELLPILQTLLPAANRDVRLAVKGIMDKKKADAEAKAYAELTASVIVILLTIFPPTAPIGLALGAGLAAYGFATGYEDYQRGKMYDLGRGGGVFTREQEDAAAMLMFMGALNMALSVFDLAELGLALRVTKVTRSLDDAAQILKVEARAGDNVLTASRTGDGPPTITITKPDGTVIRNSLDELVGSPELLAKRGLGPSDLEHLRKTADVDSAALTASEVGMEFDMVRRMSGGGDVAEIRLPNGHTWRREADSGFWCRHSNGEFCWWLGGLDELGESVETAAIHKARSPGAAGVLDPAKAQAARDARTELRSNMGPRPTAGKYQDHHIIPYELRDHPLVAEAIARGWNINGRGNGVRLPADVATQATSGTGALHRGSHPTYSRWVESRLDQLDQMWQYGDLSDGEVVDAVQELADEFFGRLDRREIKLHKKVGF